MSYHLIQPNFQINNMNSIYQNRVFTKEDFEKNYFILNSNESDSQTKILVNTYFEELKKSNQLLNICKEILIQNTNKSQDLLLFSSILIRQYLTQNINLIIQNETNYQNTKNILMELFQSLNYLSQISFKIIKFICASINIILLGGIIDFWKEGIDNLIEISNSSENNLLYSSLILAATKDELNSLKLNNNLIERIKSELQKKKEQMNYFISFIFNKVKSENNPNSILYESLINIISSIFLFDVNILVIKDLCSNLISQMALINKSELRKNITEILSDTFSYSNSSNLGNNEIVNYMKFKTFDLFIDTKLKEYERESIFNVLNMINILYLNYKDKSYDEILKNEKDIEFIFSAANIFSSLSSNYNYIFFMKGDQYNNIYLTCRILLLYFIAFPNYKISQLMFETISSINDFFQRGFSLEESDKSDFENFIFNINKYILNNTKLTQSEILDNSIFNYLNKKLKISHDTSSYNLEEIANNNINDEEKISYRKNVLSVYDDILSIYKENYKIENYFFFLGSDMDNLIKSNDLISIESILLNIYSLSPHFHSLTTQYTLILNFLDYIYRNSNVIFSSQRILISFLRFIYLYCYLIWRNNNSFINTINFLLNINNLIGNNNNEINKIEDITIYLIYRLINWYKSMLEKILKNNNQDYSNIQNIYISIYNYYVKNFNKFSYSLVGNLVKSMIEIALINIKVNKIPDSDKIMLNICQSILNQCYESIQKIINDNNQNIQIIKEEIKKIFTTYNSILSDIGFYNKELLYNLLTEKIEKLDNNYFILIYSFSKKVIELLYNEYEIMEIIFKFYILLIRNLSMHSPKLFNVINDIIFTLYNKCQNYPFIIECMNELYYNILEGNDEEKKNLINEKCFIILNQIFNFLQIQDNKNKNDILIKFSNLLQTFISKIKNFNLLLKNKFENINLFNSILNYIIIQYNNENEYFLTISLIKLFNIIYKDSCIDIEITKFYLTDIILGSIKHFDNNEEKLIHGFTHLFNLIFIANKEIFKDTFRKKFNEEIVNVIFEFFNKHSFIPTNKKSLDDTYVKNIKLISDFIKDLIEVYNYKEKEFTFIEKYNLTENKISVNEFIKINI